MGQIKYAKWKISWNRFLIILRVSLQRIMNNKINNNKLMKQNLFRLCLTAMMLLVTLASYAYDAYIDGVYYNFSGTYATVTCRVYNSADNIDAYSGDIVIPNIVDYDGKIYNVTSIGEYAFFRCSNLTSVTIPEGIRSIGYYAFSFCSSLTSVTIPNGVVSIGSLAFRGCSKLYSVAIPESVTNIGADTFEACSNLKKARFASVESLCRIPFSYPNSNPLYNAHHLYLGDCEEEVTELTIPEDITNIGVYTFNYCSNLEKCIFTSSTPSKIGSLFNSFTTIIVPDDAVEFYKSICVSNANQIFSKSSLDYVVAKTTAADGHSELLKAIGGVGKEADVVSLKVEGTINGYDIMLMRNKMTNLRYLDLSDATIVPEKDNYQYYTGYYTKENVLGDYYFYDVDNLRSVILPKNITSIGSRAFAGCDNLVKVTGMPDCCTTIGDYAFHSATHLNQVEIGEGVTSIPYYCFARSNLPTISLPNSVTSIGSYAFYSCDNMKDLKLPPSLKTIGSYAFQNCRDLTEIHIPSMLESIADNAFSNCTAAKDVYVYTLTTTSIQQNSFVYDGVTLHAPQEPEDVFWAYYNDTQWSQFTNVVPFEAKYEKWYTGEDQDITLDDGETIPNEDEDEKAEGEMRPGSCLEYLQGAYQWLNKLVMKWVGDKFPCLIDNSSVFIDELCFELDIKAGKWYFFSFPFNVDLSKCTFNGKYVWRYYDGDLRAKNGGGAWQNVTDGKLKAFQGYIFNAQKAGKITISISDPMFTGSNKRVNIAAHASSEAQDAGWSFVGNPFMSYYDLGNFIDEFDCPITVWDPVNNTYNAVVPGDDDYEFHPFEAFFVQKPEGQSNITFDKDGREGYNDAMRTLQSRRRARAAQAINPARRIVNLEISDGTTTDKTRVVFNDERQMKYEPECDASKFMSEESSVQLFTIDNDDIRYAINERPNADPSTGSGQAQCIVRLGFTAKADGTYTISAPRMDKAMALKDRETGNVHNFADGDYEFLAKAGTHMDRFVLVPEQLTTGLGSLLAEGIKVEAQDGGINIAGIEGKTASIYNAAGQLVATLTESGRTEVTPGAYVVKVGEVSTKIVVR